MSIRNASWFALALCLLWLANGLFYELSGGEHPYAVAWMLVGVGCLAAVVSSVAKAIASRVESVTRAARRIGEGDLSARARVSGRDEVAQLGEAFDSMAESLEKAEAERGSSAGEVTAILEHMADGLVVVDSAQRITLLNRAASVLLNAPPDAAGRPLEHLVRDYELIEAIARSLELRAVLEVEFDLPGDNGHVLHASVAPLTEAPTDDRGVVVVLRDVTEVRRLERVRQDFVANAGHELRTPVAAIRSLAEALESGALHDAEAGPAFLDQIVDNTQRLGRLLDDMMELARVEAGAGEPVAPIEVAPIARKAAESLGPQADAVGVNIEVHVPDSLQVLGSADNLTTALVNLLDNALKYAHEGRRLEVEILPADEVEQAVRVAVVDHGPGIPEADRRRVFERFYRLDRARSRELGGTGLGLSIVKHAVEAMGGSVSVEATPGGGATFVLVLRKPEA